MARAEEIMVQIDQLTKELEAAKLEDRAEALIDVKMKIKLYGFTATELRSVIKRRKTTKPAAKAATAGASDQKKGTAAKA